jgi:hypothetical protein
MYKSLMSELAGLTTGNPEANAIVLWHLRCAKAEAIEIRTKQAKVKDGPHVFLLVQSSIKYQTKGCARRKRVVEIGRLLFSY